MLEFIKQNKLLSVGLLLLLIGLTYLVMITKGNELPSLSEPISVPASEELIVMLTSLHSLQLNGAIFGDSIFVSLNDFGVVIPPEQIGRRNPFAPIGSSRATPVGTPSARP